MSYEFCTGKSGAAVCILEQCLYYYIRPYFSDCGKLIEDCIKHVVHPEKGFHLEMQDYAKHAADVLIIDDLKPGVGKWGDFTITIIEDILKTRANNLRPTIITTNLTMEEIYEHFGGSVQEIIIAKYAPVKLEDHNWRKAMKDTNEDYVRKYLK